MDKIYNWAQQHLLSPMHSGIQEVLKYLLHLKHSRHLLSLLWVHVAILAIHPKTDQFSVFFQPMMKSFLRGISRIYLPARDRVPMWDFNLVLTKWMIPCYMLVALSLHENGLLSWQ